MPTKSNKSSAEKYLESLAGGPLTLFSLVESIREGEEWSKKDIAQRLGVSPTYYSDFVAGRKSVSPKQAAKWAEILGYDEQQFVRLALQDQLQRSDLHYSVELLAANH